MLAGQAAGLIVAGVLWVLLFAQSFDIAPPRYPTLEAAEAVAIEAGGRHRWPATTTRVEAVDAERVDVVRTWMGVQESVVRVEDTQAGWDVASARTGPGRAVQGVLACLVPGLGAGLLVGRAVRTTTIGRPRSGASGRPQFV